MEACPAGSAEQNAGVSGIGIVLTKTKDFIYYRYLPFSSPISRDRIDLAFTQEDVNQLTNIKSNTYWLFEISHESFSNAMRDISITWP